MTIPLYSRLVLFGDSHTDGGEGAHGLCALSQDIRPMPPYFRGRWTNGPVWPEYAAPTLGVSYDCATNFAVGGAKTGTDNTMPEPIFVDTGMLAQARRCVASHPAIDPQALLVLWGGTNDLWGTPNGETTLITTAVHTQLAAQFVTTVQTSHWRSMQG